MTPECIDQAVEIALLRACLSHVTKSLSDYHEAAHFEIENDQNGQPMLEVIVPESLRECAEVALSQAREVLKDRGRER